MSKRLSYRGRIADGLQEKIRLATIDGKRGYRIKKFQIIGTAPGDQTVELTAKVYTKDQTGSITGGIDFSESDLLACSYYVSGSGVASYQTSPGFTTFIFDSEVFNQDIYITAVDTHSSNTDTNFYLELETVKLSDIQATQLTLKNLRTIASR